MPEFTRYAQMRVEQRGVTEADVESALSHRVGPDKPGSVAGAERSSESIRGVKS